MGVVGATFMGLGSILGTGVFVSLAIAAGIAGPSLLLAILLASLVALCNALGSAQLAAAHPVSGGTYEYGYTYLNPVLGFTAGWMFLCAKTASAATAALGFSAYLMNLIGADDKNKPVAVGAILILTVIASMGLKQSNKVNIAIVVITIAALSAFIVAVLPRAWENGFANFVPFFEADAGGILHATALMFVAFAGYARIATLGEEVRDPIHTIPRAIIVTLILTVILYVAVGSAAIGAAGAKRFHETTVDGPAPLESIARNFGLPGFHRFVAVGAVTAMLGVLLNLILGLSRVLLAMGRRKDAPSLLARLDASGRTPYVAVWLVGIAIALLASAVTVKASWSFSAFAVLVYYAITNLAVLRLPPKNRLYSRLWAWGGLASCLSLAFWVERQIWLLGLGLIAAGVLWFLVAGKFRSKNIANPEL